MSIQKDIHIDQGSDFEFNLQLEVLTNPLLEYCPDTNPYVPLYLSTYSATMIIQADYYSAPLLTFDTSRYITLDNLGNLKVSIHGLYTNSIVLPDEINNYVYQIEISQLTYVKKVCIGNFIITKNIL